MSSLTPPTIARGGAWSPCPELAARLVDRAKDGHHFVQRMDRRLGPSVGGIASQGIGLVVQGRIELSIRTILPVRGLGIRPQAVSDGEGEAARGEEGGIHVILPSLPMIVARVGNELVIDVRAVEYRPLWSMTSAASQSTPVTARPPTAVTDFAAPRTDDTKEIGYMLASRKAPPA